MWFVCHATIGIIQEGCTNSNATVTNLRTVAERSLELGGVPLVYECHANCRSIVIWEVREQEYFQRR